MPASQAYPIAAAKRQLQAALRQMQQRAEQTLHALAALSGKTPNDLPTLQASHLASVPTLPSDTLTADLLGKRPDIAAQREAILARNQLIKAARADFYPNIRISALAGLSELKIAICHISQPNGRIVAQREFADFHIGRIASQSRAKTRRI